MKTFLLAMAFATSFAASAQVYVYPTIFNFGNSVQVQIHNTTKEDISCSGTVYMNTQLGRMETGYYFDQIRKGSMSMRTFYPMMMDARDRISYAHHSIYCREVP